MKRILSLVTLIAMLASMMLSVPVFADNNAKLDLKQAIEVAKKSFEIKTDNYDFNSNYSETQYGKMLWYLNWNSKSSNGSSISITVDASTGEIINMSRWDAQATPPGRIPKYSKDEALKVAKDMANKLNPGKFKETSLLEQGDNNAYSPYYSSDVYSFSFIRKIKGIDFQNNSIVVNVDKNTLSVRYYNVDWDDVIPIPDSSKAISIEAAKKIFSDKLGIELAYQMVYPSPTGDPKVILVYNLKNGNQPIDALTGEVITKPYQGPMYAMNEKRAADAGMGAYVPTPEEQKVIDDTSKYITKDKAIEAVKKYITIDSKYKIDNSSLYGNQRLNEATWNFSWSYSDKEKNTYSYISAAVDAVSGELRNFYISGSEDEPKKGETPKYTEAQCKEIGEKLLKEIQPDKFGSVEFRKPAVDYTVKTGIIPTYNFNYIRKVNGISFPGNNLNVTVSAYTGKVTGFNMTWNNMEFPDAKGTISLEEAYKVLYSKNDLLLNYIRLYSYEPYNDTTSIKLIYMLNNYTGMIDAKTGKFIDYNGNPIKETVKTAFTDINGSKNEADIKLLVELGIIESTGDKFNPDSKILQKDFIKFLMKSIQPEYIIYSPTGEGNEYDRYYEMAIQQNIIAKQDKNPEANITRIEAAKMLVKALGVGFVADLGDIYVLGFKDEKDIATADRGYAAISSALGLVDAIDGSYAPNGQIARADTAAMLVKFLKVSKTPNDSAVTPLITPVK